MSDITIPPVALEAVNRVLDRYLGGGYTQSDVDTVARAACLAMLKSWPGAWLEEEGDEGEWGMYLPLTENSDDK